MYYYKAFAASRNPTATLITYRLAHNSCSLNSSVYNLYKWTHHTSSQFWIYTQTLLKTSKHAPGEHDCTDQKHMQP